MEKFFKNLDYAAVLILKDQVEYLKGQVVSKTLAQNDAFSMTLFAIAAGEGISAHKSTGDALVYCLEGRGEIRIDDQPAELGCGQCIVMPAGHPHALAAKENFKFLLVVAFQ